MACRESGGSKILLCFGLFVVASSFCNCTKLTRLKTLIKWRDNSTLSQSQGSDLRHGRLLIGQDPLRHAKLKGTKATKNFMDVDSGYQADIGQEMSWQPKGQGDVSSKTDHSAVERLLKMEPKVECTGDSMKLKVQDAASTSGSLFFVDRGSHLSPLPLSKLPSSCGYTLRSTRRDMVLVAPYDGCFVTLEEDCYVLPLLWCGLPVRMSCPLMRQSSPNPPMVTCHAEGMVVKTEWAVSVDKIKVNLNGGWEPLMRASPRCGFSVVVHPEGVVISVRYAPCVEKKDGMYTIELAGDGETKISCPSLSPARPEPTKGPNQQTDTPSKGVYPSNQSHKLTSTRAPDQTLKNPVQTVVPQVPGIPQIPGGPNQKQNQGQKDVVQPQLPYFYPNFFYPQPANPENKPTVQQNPTTVAKKNEEQQSQQTVPPAKLPVTQPPNGQVEQPFYPYPFYVMPNPDVAPAHRPELKPSPTTSSVIQTTKGQRKQPFYPLPFYPQPPKPDNPPTQPPVTKPNTKHFLPNPSGPTQKPVEPPASQSEDREYKPFYPFPYLLPPQPPASETPPVKPPILLHPENPDKPSPVKPVPPVSKEPQGQIYRPIHPPFLPYGPYQTPVPPTEQILTSAPKGEAQPLSPLQPEAPSKHPLAPEGKKPVYPFYYIQPPQPEAPQGQVQQPFYPYPFYPVPENQPATKPTAAPEPPKAPQPEAPQGQVQQPFYPYPFYPVPENQPATKPTTAPEPPKAPQPEAPQGQVHQTLYPNPPYPLPEPENKPPTKPTTAPEPPKAPQPEAPQGQVQRPFYPYPFYPVPENQPATKPTAAPEPPKAPHPEAPQGQVQQPFYPYPFYPVPENLPATKPTSITESPATQTPKGQVHQHVTLPPAFSTQQPQWVTPVSGQKTLEPTIQQTSNVGIVPQGPQLGTPNMSPVYCPQFCSPGFFNCCPQIAFHQHLHHIVPAGLGSKDTPPIYPGLPFLHPMAYSLPSGNEKQPYLQPPDGNPTALPGNNPTKPTNPELPIFPFVPDPDWPYLLQNGDWRNLPQSQSPTHSYLPSIPQTRVSDLINPAVQYEPYNVQPPKQQNGQLSYVGQYLQQQHINNQNKLAAKELQPFNKKSSKSKWPAHPKTQSEFDPHSVPSTYYMLQDAQAPTYNKSLFPNNYLQPQPTLSGSKNSSEHEQTAHSSESKSYVLLQHGPPGREPNDSFAKSPQPFRDLVRDTNVLVQNLARHHNSKPQHPQDLSLPQGTPQHPKWLDKGMTNPLISNVNYMPRPGDGSGLPFFTALDGVHLVPLPQDPSLIATQIKPKFVESLKDLRKPNAPLGSSRRTQPHVPGKAFQQRSSAADHHVNGLNQLIQREGGNQKQK